MTPRTLAKAILERVRCAEIELRTNGRPVRVDGRDWVELVGERVELEVPTIVLSEEEARDVARELADLAPRHGFVDRFEREAFDFRVHAAVLRRALEEEELHSRRVVSAVGPPRCPTAIQVLRRGDVLEVVGFMRSERLVPLLPLDLLNYLWAAGEALNEAGVAGGSTTRVVLLIGSLHATVEESFLPVLRPAMP